MPMNYLGIDYGQKHLGLALAMSPIAEPLDSLEPSMAQQKISQLVKKYNIQKIIIGLPDENQRESIQQFFSSLDLECQLVLVDETLSSHDARHALLHTSQTSRQKKEHSVAAAIILQSYIDNLSVDF